MDEPRIAKAGDWRTEPFQPLTPIPYRADFSKEEFTRIKRGFIPKEMENKWFIYYEDGVLYIHRSWTGRGIFKVRFDVGEQGASVKEASTIHDPNPSEYDMNYSVRLLHCVISNILLGKHEEFDL